MVKATLRSGVLLGIVAVGMLFTSAPSFAEVQNVRVGGDVTVRGFYRSNVDLNANNDSLDDEHFVQQTTGINIGADLTENVSAFLRIANERDWNVDSSATGDFDISQGYVTLKELFYSPLTLTVGTQPIVWGRGFVLGSNLLGSVILGGGDRNGAITANEFTDFTSFDAIRATLDLGGIAALDMPLTIDYVYIKQNENTTGQPDDVNIQGFNISTTLDEQNAEMEAYYLNERDKNLALCAPTSSGAGECKNGSVSTIGMRGSVQPVEGSYLYGELAYQFGDRIVDLSQVLASGDAQQAWAANLGGDYTFTDVSMTPKLGAEWRFYSGKNVDGAVGGWRPIAPGYFRTAIREFETRSTITGFNPNFQTGVTSGQTNQHELAIYGGFKPIEDLNVDQRLAFFILPIGAIPPGGGSPHRNSYLGTEWDTVLTYDYTDDVQFGLIYGLFKPGNVFRDNEVNTAQRNAAQELITSVSVKF